jgi:uncharacterized protein
MHANIIKTSMDFCNPEMTLKLAGIADSILPADKIFLLGGSSHQQTSESIFYASPCKLNNQFDYFFLVLCNDLQHRPPHEWQDKMESHCQKQVPVTILLLETARFREWLANGHLFARRVVNDAPVIMDNSQENFMIPVKNENLSHYSIIEAAIKYNMKNAEEFMSGADLYINRKQPVMAAFMLHQATEQALAAIIKKGTGYHSHTHNLQRLIRFCSLVTHKVAMIFPGQTEKEKQQFRLLQKAYSDSRYRIDYSIGLNDLLDIKEKVLLLKNLALEGCTMGQHI